jgi:hypothetical protein
MEANQNDIYSPPKKKLMVMCHTQFGDPNDPLGRFSHPGMEYEIETEPSGDRILCWVNFSENFGSRFAITGNVYDVDPKGYWPNLLDYFECPLQRERNKRLKEIGIK